MYALLCVIAVVSSNTDTVYLLMHQDKGNFSNLELGVYWFYNSISWHGDRRIN